MSYFLLPFHKMHLITTGFEVHFTFHKIHLDKLHLHMGCSSTAVQPSCSTSYLLLLSLWHWLDSATTCPTSSSVLLVQLAVTWSGSAVFGVRSSSTSDGDCSLLSSWSRHAGEDGAEGGKCDRSPECFSYSKILKLECPFHIYTRNSKDKTCEEKSTKILMIVK